MRMQLWNTIRLSMLSVLVALALFLTACEMDNNVVEEGRGAVEEIIGGEGNEEGEEEGGDEDEEEGEDEEED